MKHISRAYIKKQIKKYQYLMGLDNWTIKVNYTPDESDSFADVHSLPQYYKAVININLDKCTTKKVAKLTIIHELAHVALSLYTDAARHLASGRGQKVLTDLEEVVVSNIENWPLWNK